MAYQPVGMNWTNWDQVMEHFLKGLHDICAYFHEVYFHSKFWPSYLRKSLYVILSLLHHEYNSVNTSKFTT